MPWLFISNLDEIELMTWRNEGCAHDPGEKFSRRIRCRIPKVSLRRCWITSTQGILRERRNLASA